MAQNPAVDALQTMPRKRAPPFTNFLGRILPSRRPEQGGTLRMQDDRSPESAYRDLAIDPETLTHWSIAQDLPAENIEHIRCRPASSRPLTSQKARIASRPKRSRTARKPPAPLRRAKALSAAEIHALVESKERTRQQRREQKARGDWLGVTGADPCLGEYLVLTPTDSPSSDTTAPSDADRMAKLAKEETEAKKAYDGARRRKEQERERLELEKAQSRLGKIERLKSGQKLRHHPGKWIRGRGYWSSVAEPDLSTIAQSSASYEQMQNTSGCDTVTASAAASASVLAPAQENDDQGEAIISSSPYARDGNVLGKLPSLRHASTDTIIHTPAPRQLDHHIALAEYAPKSQYDGKSEIESVKSPLMLSKKSFLWGRRRRVTDPGGQVPNRAAATSLPTMGEPSARLCSPDLEPARQTDHFTGLVIPDHHLGPIHPERGQDIRRLSRETTISPLPTGSNTQGCRASEEGIPVPWQLRGKTLGQKPQGRGGAPVTVTSSQSKSNNSPKHPSDHLKLVTEPMDGDRVTRNGHIDQPILRQSYSAPCRENQPLDDRNPGTMEDSRTVASKSVKGVHEGKSRRCLSVEQKSEIIETIRSQGAPSPPNSACTPTTITTGCAVNLLIRPISQALLEPTNDRGDICTAPVSMRPSNAQSSVYSASCSLPGPGQRPLAATVPKGELKGAQDQSTPNLDAQTSMGPSRFSKPGHKNESALSRRTARKADGTIGPKITQTGSTAAALGPKAPPPPSRAPPAVPTKAVECALTGQEAARTAMLRSRTREATRSSEAGIKKRRRQSPSPGPAKTEAQKQEAADAVGTDAPSQPTRTPAPAPAPLAPAPKRDAVDTVGAVGAFATSGVWAAAWAWWAVVQPAFDGSSKLWARRSRQESTWIDVAILTLAGVSCLIGMVAGLHAFQVLWWLLRL